MWLTKMKHRLQLCIQTITAAARKKWTLIFLSEVNASYSCHVGRKGKNILFMQETTFMRAF